MREVRAQVRPSLPLDRCLRGRGKPLPLLRDDPAAVGAVGLQPADCIDGLIKCVKTMQLYEYQDSDDSFSQ